MYIFSVEVSRNNKYKTLIIEFILHLFVSFHVINFYNLSFFSSVLYLLRVQKVKGTRRVLYSIIVNEIIPGLLLE